MPAMSRVVAHWRDHSQEMDWLRSHDIGWGEPFCFACGWLAPVGLVGIADGTPVDRCVAIVWTRATCWLDRAHLHDRFWGGPDEPHNLVPLCHLCHAEMTERDFPSREAGLAWVEAHPERDMVWQAFTDAHLMGRTPSRSTLYRARARYADLMVKAERQMRQRDSPPGPTMPSRTGRRTHNRDQTRSTRSPTG